MIRLTRLHAVNYRSLKDVTVELSDLTVFVGPNGSGKSNILDAIQFISDALRENLDYAIINKRQGMSAIRHWSAKGRPVDVKLEINFVSTDKESKTVHGSYAIVLGSARRGEYSVKSETLTTGSTTRNLRDPKLNISDNSLGLRLIPIVGARVELYRYLLRSQRYVIYPDALREPQKLANDQELLPRGENLASVLRRMKKSRPQSFNSLRNALSAIVPGISDVSTQQVGSYLSVSLVHARQATKSPTFDLGTESDGTIRSLALLTALYNTSSARYISLEEPELTIHPGAVRVLADAILQVSTTQQLFVTTHDPDLLDYFPIESIRVVRLEGLSTIVESVVSNQIAAARERLVSPGELLRTGVLRGQTDDGLYSAAGENA